MDQQEERTVSFFRFEDLRVYAKATDYATWVSTQVGAPRTESEKTLAASLCHSSYDIALNIAEGSSRSKSQFDHYLKIAKTAIRECVVYTEVAHNLGLMNDDQYNQSREYLMELTRMLGALIISLQRSAERRSEQAEEEQGDPYANDMSY
ncbi:MAG: four helix bundle protein [Bacteroidales bacterium]|nr:four helix bundle protein [Bacteroidales bacterium]